MLRCMYIYIYIYIYILYIYIYIYTQILTYKLYLVKTGLFHQFILFDMSNNLGSQNIIYKTDLYWNNMGLELGIKY